jgi:hypothetical protein
MTTLCQVNVGQLLSMHAGYRQCLTTNTRLKLRTVQPANSLGYSSQAQLPPRPPHYLVYKKKKPTATKPAIMLAVAA